MPTIKRSPGMKFQQSAMVLCPDQLPPIVDETVARQQGYIALTTPYYIYQPKHLASGANVETKWLLRVLADMEGVDHCLVSKDGGLEVWRQPAKPLKRRRK